MLKYAAPHRSVTVTALLRSRERERAVLRFSTGCQGTTTMDGMNRRELFVGTAGLAAAALAVGRADAATTGQAPAYSAEHPDMLLAYVTGKLNALAAQWDAVRERIHTAQDVEERNRFVREKFREMLRPFPDRNPLSPVVIATHQREGYRVENLMFQSRPNFWVTGNLYVPSEGRGPYPAVISPCGHYPLARMEPEYQCVYVDLVKAGFVVLAYDPIGQGERRQYWNPETGETEVAKASTYEHSMPGQVLLLMGENLTNYRVWDGMRAIDYLETRPEVDRNRIGCAGHSGGGTLTMFISAVDERVKCAVINEGGTTNRWPIELRPEMRVGPGDVEQNPFPAAKYGIDDPDLHVAIAPRPLLALIENYNPRFNRAAEHIRMRYAQLGAADRFGTEEATDPHAWTPKLRLATVNWMSRWFYNRPGPAREADFPIEAPETLYCTPDGSLRYSQEGDSIFSLILKKQAHLPPPREWGAPEAARELQSLLRFRRTSGPLAPRTRVVTPRKGYSVEKLEFLSEPGIYIPTWVFVPERKSPAYSTVLAFDDAGKQAEGMEFGRYERLARDGKLVIACDVRGIGETKPPHSPASEWPGEFRQLFDVETAIVYMTWFMDESLLGMRVQDVIRSVDYAYSRPDVDKQNLHVTGKGAGALWVLFAAVLDNRIKGVACERGLASYGLLARVDRYTHSSGVFVPDILTKFDIPELAAVLTDRRVELVSPVDHMKRPLDRHEARTIYAPAFEAFRQAGAADNFRIVHQSS